MATVTREEAAEAVAVISKGKAKEGKRPGGARHQEYEEHSAEPNDQLDEDGNKFMARRRPVLGRRIRRTKRRSAPGCSSPIFPPGAHVLTYFFMIIDSPVI